MIQRHDRNRPSDRRRVLYFPAVHPCEGISPATLLGSLTDLGRQICDSRSRFFATQRRNSKEIIRLVGNLLEFLDEVRETRSFLSRSAVLCFSELHLVFQKIGFLLEDCSRDGARIWILMKSQFVAGQFRLLVRSIATALEVLPLDSIDAGEEVKELVNLVAKQGREARFELDHGDEYAMSDVRLILDYFEKGIEPDKGLIGKVLDYVGVKSWSDCQNEIRFLEEEISFDSSECDGKESQFLSSLDGFMSYCRGVIFESSDYSLNWSDQSEENGVVNEELLSCLNPEDFRCPISLEIMKDPVTISTGQTYDRPSIQKWLKGGNLICPKTGEKLTSADFFVPNTALWNIIEQFCNLNGIPLRKPGGQNRNIAKTADPGSPAASGAIKSVSRFLARRLVFGSDEQTKKAVLEVRLLSKSNIFNRKCLVDAGAVPPLLSLVSSADPVTQENSVSALLKISKQGIGRRAIVEYGGLRLIVSVLKHGLTPESKQAAAATVFYLSLIKGCQKRIGEMPETIPALAELIKDGNPCGRKNAMVAIFGLLLYPRNHQKVLESGTIPAIIEKIVSPYSHDSSSSSTDEAELLVDSLAILASLAEKVEGTIAIMKTPLVPLLVGILRSCSSRVGKEYAVSILLLMCRNGGNDVIAPLARDPTLMGSLYSILHEGGSSSSGKKVRSLIKSLLNFNERNYYLGSGNPSPRIRYGS